MIPFFSILDNSIFSTGNANVYPNLHTFQKSETQFRRVKKWMRSYYAFHKHANSKVQKPPSQLRFSLLWIIITITSNDTWNTETHKTDQNPQITNHKPWPFEPVKVKFCFLRGPLRWLTAAKNAIVSWLLNFRIRMFVKSAVIVLPQNKFYFTFHEFLKLSCAEKTSLKYHYACCIFFLSGLSFFNGLHFLFLTAWHCKERIFTWCEGTFSFVARY